MVRALALVVCVLIPQIAFAQAAGGNDPLPIPPAAQAVLDVFDRPLHPIVGGVAPGGGIGVGVGYDTPRHRDWFHNAKAMVTISQYWSLEAETGYQTQKTRFGVFEHLRQMGGLDFYGIGPQSDVGLLSNFKLRENEIGLRGWTHPLANVRAGGTIELYDPALGPGPRHEPSLEQVFAPPQVPGFDATPTFSRYRGFVEVTYPRLADTAVPDSTYRRYEGTYQLALEAVRDHDGGFYNFHRLELEGRQEFAGIKPGQRLTLHGLLAVTNSNAVVPFYLQYTLGGSGLSAFRPETIGTDGTRATLRGYRNYRFRDKDLLLAQAEYRIPLSRHVHTTVFYDVGQVAPRASDFGSDLKQDTGFSISFMRKDTALIRLDVGYGGGEGVHYFWGFGGLGF